MKTPLIVKSLLFVSLVSLLSACGTAESEQQPNIPAPQVSVATVVNERLTEWDEFTGRIQAPQTVELRPRVSGYVDIVAFKEGSMVNAGDTLFLIENRQFKAEVKRLKADLLYAQSQQDLAEREHKRAVELSAKQAISAELLDSRLANVQQAKAKVESVGAALDLAKLNLGYTRVEAPIAGRVSNALITKGNYVTAGESVLTSIVSTQKVYAYFDADEQTYLKYTKLAQQGERPSSRSNPSPVMMALANDAEFRYTGQLDFLDNSVNASTGTIRGRAIFDNQDGSLIPGLFARLKLVGSASYNGILIDDKAIGTDLNNKFVLVLDDSNTLQYRAVELGEKLHGLRIIKSGLSAGEKIVVNGLQRVRPGATVTPQDVDMVAEQTINRIHSLQQRIDAAQQMAEQQADETASVAVERLVGNTVVGG
ncbi:efflux RND transporter periplasmic adaptor subunit [Neptunicella sp. SCSIO 80796]|uniref:efflux RND transporter periplasmic adaptor subunit n=1 Tax=Neptunicella plasticusilytica TaxID=3117012 RepID=UPI003A4E30BD